VNWTWSIRARDGGMNGLEFSRCTTAGGFSRVLVHAAPARASLEVVSDDGAVIAKGDIDRTADYTPMTLIELAGGTPRRVEVWPEAELIGSLVLLSGGEAGVLRSWQHAEDHSWWRWTVEFSNHVGRPPNWSPER
jgi:hypothetical protein